MFKPTTPDAKKINLMSYKIAIVSKRQPSQFQPIEVSVEVVADLSENDVKASIDECHRLARSGIEREFTEELKARGLG